MAADRVLFMYSGGVEASLALAKLTERRRTQVVTLSLDLGQGDALDDVRRRALAIGATRAHVLDAREPFAKDVIRPALVAGAFQAGRLPFAACLVRPMVARQAVEVARVEGVATIAHGAFGDAASQIERLIAGIDPSFKVAAPTRDAGWTRESAIGAAVERGLPLSPGADGDYDVYRDLWGRAVTGGTLDDLAQEPPAGAYALTKSPEAGLKTPAVVEIEFSKGVPVALNGSAMFLGDLIQSLEAVAGAHAVGRLDRVDTIDGAPRRRVHEMPAAAVLACAHRDLQALVLPPDLDELVVTLGGRYADLIASGRWFTPARAALDAFATSAQATVTGSIRLKLFSGNVSITGRHSPHARLGSAAPSSSAVLI